MLASIRRGKDGIDDLVSRYTSGQVEEERAVATVGENKFYALLDKYKEFLGNCEYQKSWNAGGNIFSQWLSQWGKDYIRNPSTDILSPAEINLFLQETIPFEESEDYEATGIFVTRLIQSSYNAGHNDFKLTTTNLKKLNRVGAFLEGKEGNPLILSIDGDVGEKCCLEARNVNFTIYGNLEAEFAEQSVQSSFTIHGDAENDLCSSSQYTSLEIFGYAGVCGMFAEHSTFKIHGNASMATASGAKWSTFDIDGDVFDEVGYEAKNCIINIKGNADEYFMGEADNCTVIINGTIGEHCGAYKDDISIKKGSLRNTTFKTSNRGTLQKFLAEIPYGNRIIYVDNGKEIIYGDNSPTRVWYNMKHKIQEWWKR